MKTILLLVVLFVGLASDYNNDCRLDYKDLATFIEFNYGTKEFPRRYAIFARRYQFRADGRCRHCRVVKRKQKAVQDIRWLFAPCGVKVIECNE